MTSATPTVLTFEANSAWIVILAVSAVTLVATLFLRRLFARPGGMYSGLLLLLPLVLPLVAAAIYQSGVLPEISVLKPAGAGLADGSQALLRLLRVTDRESGVSAFYAVTGSPGGWLIVFGVAASTFMLVRRAVGTIVVRRLVAKCVPLDDPGVQAVVEALSARAGLAREPQVMRLPEGLSGAFATGFTRGKVLLSCDLLADLEPEELEGVIAHEISHLQARDVGVTSVAGLLRDLVAWNPLAHIAYRRLCVDREFEADRRAAALTGSPLAVASGLLKAVELMRGRRSLANSTVLAFLRPGALISRRINGLIAVADGRADVSPAGHMPFVLAGMLVITLGLQVGAKIATEQSGLAIVWGHPARSDGDVWEAPKRLRAAAADPTPNWERSGKRGKADLQRPIRLLGLDRVVRVKESDLDLWMGLVDRRVRKAGLQAATLRWEARRQYQAVPLISRLPLGIYRIVPERA